MLIAAPAAVRPRKNPPRCIAPPPSPRTPLSRPPVLRCDKKKCDSQGLPSLCYLNVYPSI